MRLFLSLFSLMLMMAAAPAFALTLASSQGHQLIKAEVIDPNPSRFTINLKKIANIGVDGKAPTYAMYVTSSAPKTCADFSKIDIDYQKPDKYHRIFDLSHNQNVLTALHDYGCVIIPNKPRFPPAKS